MQFDSPQSAYNQLLVDLVPAEIPRLLKLVFDYFLLALLAWEHAFNRRQDPIILDLALVSFEHEWFKFQCSFFGKLFYWLLFFLIVLFIYVLLHKCLVPVFLSFAVLLNDDVEEKFKKARPGEFRIFSILLLGDSLEND